MLEVAPRSTDLSPMWSNKQEIIKPQGENLVGIHSLAFWEIEVRMVVAIIYLGSKCNLNCRYCHREIEKDKPLDENFIKSLKEPMFIFKGGEPLLYMDTIKRIKEIHPNAIMSITTNGKGIENHIDFIKGNQISIYLSYDYDGGRARGYVPDFSLPIPFNVTSTMYHGNTDLLRWCDEHYEMCKGLKKWFNFYPHIMHCTNDKNQEIALTKEDYDEILDVYHQAFVDLDNIKLHPLRRKIATVSRSKYKFGDTRCMNDNVIRCDTLGNVFTCSYIRDANINVKDRTSVIESKFPSCKGCEFYDLCGSMCVQSRNHELECYYGKKMYSMVRKYFTTSFANYVKDEHYRIWEDILTEL